MTDIQPSLDAETRSVAPSVFAKLPASIQAALTKQGILEPTPIQSMSFEPCLGGRDLLAQSRTGSGKTLAFALPSALRLKEFKDADPKETHPRMLVLAPTRELADQVAEVFEKTFASLAIKVLCITGGKSYRFQVGNLKRGIDVVVGTPGRVVDLLEQKLLDLSKIKIFVLDEVDQMLDFGFSEALNAICDQMPAQKQTLFFSATFNSRVSQIANRMCKNALDVRVTDKDNEVTGSIEHAYIEVARGKNLLALVNLLLFHAPSQALVFCQTKQECSDVHRALMTRGIEAGVLNGDMKQAERSVTMAQFKDKSLKILVATDVAARGIDVNELSHVINFSVPERLDSFTHRVGRTGRAGAEGKAWTIVTPDLARDYNDIVRRSRIKPIVVAVPTSKDIAERQLKKLTNTVFEKKTASAAHIEELVGNFVEAMSDEDIREKFTQLVVHQMSGRNFAGYDAAQIIAGRKLVLAPGEAEPFAKRGPAPSWQRNGPRDSKAYGKSAGNSKPPPKFVPSKDRAHGAPVAAAKSAKPAGVPQSRPRRPEAWLG